MAENRFLWTVYITELILVLLSLGVSRVSRGVFFPYPIELSLTSLLFGFTAAIPVAIAVFMTMAGPLSRHGWIKRSMSRILKKLRAPFASSILALSGFDIVLLSLAAGIGEELFFRGLLQSFVGVWWAAIIFGLLHALTPAYFVMATAIGVWFGLLYEYSGNLLVPILSHATYDIFALYLLRLQFSRQSGF